MSFWQDPSRHTQQNQNKTNDIILNLETPLQRKTWLTEWQDSQGTCKNLQVHLFYKTIISRIYQQHKISRTTGQPIYLRNGQRIWINCPQNKKYKWTTTIWKKLKINNRQGNTSQTSLGYALKYVYIGMFKIQATGSKKRWQECRQHWMEYLNLQ